MIAEGLSFRRGLGFSAEGLGSLDAVSTPPQPPGTDGHLRIGTAQRELALEVLRNAAADERISFDELEGRVPRAVHAVTRADLAAVLDDLLPAARLAELVGSEAPIGEGPGYTWDDPLVLETTGWKEMVLAGPWVVPPFLEIHTSIGGVRLDFTDAEPRSKVIDVVLMVNDWGTTTVIVPEGWGVDTGFTQAEVGYVEARGVRTRAQPGKPRVILRGRTSGQVKVRSATDADRRKTEKFLAKGRPGMPELPRA